VRAWLTAARVRLVSVAIVLVGFVGALVIYLTATPAPANPLGYDPGDTKRYLREMEVYGGKANVLASDFREWYAGLWHGKPLAGTVACLSIVAALAFWFFATPLPGEVDRAAKRERKLGGP